MEQMNASATNPLELAGMAQARAAFFSFLNLHFTTLPDAAFVKRLREGELSSVLEMLLEDPSMEGDIAEGARLMGSYLEATRQAPLDQLVEYLGVDRTRLYRGVAQGFGPPPPYELVWGKSVTDYSILEAVVRAYREMDLAQSPEARERLDYIGIEMDFMRELAQREAAAWEAGEADKAKKLLAAQQAFMSQHLGSWAPSFIEKAFEYAETDFYKGHLFMLRGFLAAQKEELSSLKEEIKA